METIYSEISDRIKAKLPEVLWNDLFNNQFESMESSENNEYAIPLPAILIEVGDIEWKTKAKQLQEGKCIIRVHIGQELYTDTYQGSAQRTASLNVLAFRKKVHSVLQGFSGTEFGPLDRKRTLPDTNYKALHVYIEEYECLIIDNSAYEDRDKLAVTPNLKVNRGDVIKEVIDPAGPATGTPYVIG